MNANRATVRMPENPRVRRLIQSKLPAAALVLGVGFEVDVEGVLGVAGEPDGVVPEPPAAWTVIASFMPEPQ